jgi:hypothetical protein
VQYGKHLECQEALSKEQHNKGPLEKKNVSHTHTRIIFVPDTKKKKTPTCDPPFSWFFLCSSPIVQCIAMRTTAIGRIGDHLVARARLLRATSK